MHLNEMARELQITTQELRRELAKTNFGISPGVHEIDDNLSIGIIRFLKGKIKPTLKNRKVAVILKDGTVAKKQEEVEPEKKKEEKEEKKKPVRAMTKREKEEMEAKKKKETTQEEPIEEVKENKKVDRSHVPKNAPNAVSDSGKALHVSRRIEVSAGKKRPLQNFRELTIRLKRNDGEKVIAKSRRIIWRSFPGTLAERSRLPRWIIRKSWRMT